MIRFNLCNLTLLLCFCIYAVAGEDRWVWRTHNRHERAFRDTRLNGIRNPNDKYRSELYGRDREPTTKRPIPGELQNDDIEDYPDSTIPANNNNNNNNNNKVGTRQYPGFIPQTAAGQFAGQGFGGFGAGSGFGGAAFAPGLGNLAGVGANGFQGANPGILVGPGGPTGIIGRPQQQQFPGIGYNQPGYAGIGQNALNGGYPGAFGAGSNNYPTQGYFPGAQAGLGQFPGGTQGLGQYPGAGAQTGLGQYPGAIGQYPTQFPIGTQYPGVEYAGNQYNPTQQYGGPQFTEGYGLAYTNGQSNLYGGGGGFPGLFRFDENANKRNGVVVVAAEGKNANIESRSTTQGVDDKVNKNLKS